MAELLSEDVLVELLEEGLIELELLLEDDGCTELELLEDVLAELELLEDDGCTELDVWLELLDVLVKLLDVETLVELADEDEELK